MTRLICKRMVTALVASFFLSALPGGVRAQENTYELTEMPLNTLTHFVNPSSNWKLVGSLSGTFDDVSPKSTEGSGILLNDFNRKELYQENVNLFTAVEHGDIALSLDFLMPKGSNSGIYLQGRYEIQLFDSWGVKVPRSLDCGGIYERWDERRPDGSKGFEGHAPRHNAALAPNLWQHLYIEFSAPRFDASGKKVRAARFVKVVLNGVIIHENIVVHGPTRAAAFNDERSMGPLMIQGDHGPVAFRNIRYALLRDVDAKITDLHYQYYEGKFNSTFGLVHDSTLVRSGHTPAIDVRLADDPNNLCLVFKGKIRIEEGGPYRFMVRRAGPVKFSIDGKEVINSQDWWEDVNASAELVAGVHEFELGYIRNFSWGRAAIGLWLVPKNGKPVALHAPTSVPEPPMTPRISVHPLDQAEVVRCFMVHRDVKRTHILASGTPSRVHYAYDLTTAGLLFTWKGEFLDVTDMWHERGEPQTASPLGAFVTHTGECPIIVGESSTSGGTSKPDALVFKGYQLDKGYPVFAYRYRGVNFTDALQPDNSGRGLARIIKVEGVSDSRLTIRLAEANKIIKVGDDLYAVGDQQYYVKLAAGDRKKVKIKGHGDRQQLIITPSAAGEVHFSIIW